MPAHHVSNSMENLLHIPTIVYRDQPTIQSLSLGSRISDWKQRPPGPTLSFLGSDKVWPPLPNCSAKLNMWLEIDKHRHVAHIRFVIKLNKTHYFITTISGPCPLSQSNSLSSTLPDKPIQCLPFCTLSTIKMIRS